MLYGAKVTIGTKISWIELSTNRFQALQNALEQIAKQNPPDDEEIKIVMIPLLD